MEEEPFFPFNNECKDLYALGSSIKKSIIIEENWGTSEKRQGVDAKFETHSNVISERQIN